MLKEEENSMRSVLCSGKTKCEAHVSFIDFSFGLGFGFWVVFFSPALFSSRISRFSSTSSL